MRELFTIMTVGIAAQFIRVLFKLVTTRYYVPGLSEFWNV